MLLASWQRRGLTPLSNTQGFRAMHAVGDGLHFPVSEELLVHRVDVGRSMLSREAARDSVGNPGKQGSAPQPFRPMAYHGASGKGCICVLADGIHHSNHLVRCAQSHTHPVSSGSPRGYSRQSVRAMQTHSGSWRRGADSPVVACRREVCPEEAAGSFRSGHQPRCIHGGRLGEPAGRRPGHGGRQLPLTLT